MVASDTGSLSVGSLAANAGGAGARGTTPAARRSDIALYGVYEISKLLTAPGRLETTLAGVLQLLSSFLDMRHALIALLGERGDPEVVVGAGWSEAFAKRFFERLPERAIGRIVTTKMPLVIEHMKADPLFENWDFSQWDEAEIDSSFIGVPIKDRGHVIGTLTIDREHGDVPYFSFDEDVRFLTMVANLLGQTVRLQRLIVRDRERLMDEQRRLEKTLEHFAPAPERVSGCAADILGNTPAIRAVLEKVRRVARGQATVLLRGESGTGKEMFAKALHELSPRCKGPFVAVNCAALAESVLESELFGHEKGAFTGAVSQRKGRFELADGGTLFLDEIGDVSAAFQAKLLRVLQQGQFERVGGTSTIKVDVRLVAATNRNLEEMVAKGEFRADLYYRVSVVPIFLPPLRERRADIALLAREFLKRFNVEHSTAYVFAESALAVLTACYFPGNVRELENCVRRTATLAHGRNIVADDFACRHDQCLSATLWRSLADSSETAPAALANTADAPGTSPDIPWVPVAEHRAPTPLRSSEEREGGATAAPDPSLLNASTPSASALPVAPPVSPQPSAAVVSAEDSADSHQLGIDRLRLIEAMEKAGWVQAKAARLLKLTPRQIGYALRKQGIPVKKF